MELLVIQGVLMLMWRHDSDLNDSLVRTDYLPEMIASNTITLYVSDRHGIIVTATHSGTCQGQKCRGTAHSYIIKAHVSALVGDDITFTLIRPWFWDDRPEDIVVSVLG